MTITSKSNVAYKSIESLKQKKYRTKYQQYIVEGIKLVAEALTAKADVVSIAVSETFAQNNDVTAYDDYSIICFSDDLFSHLSATKTPQGILAVVHMEEVSISVAEDGFYLYCDGVNDPGNAGTLIRIADACGCDAVLFSEGSVDIYSDKTVRAAMGSFFHIAVENNTSSDWLADRKMQGFRIIGGILSENTIPYTMADMTKPLVVVVGNEANGISPIVQKICTEKVKIPIYGRAESLNVGVAAAVLCYESCRQQKNGDLS